MTLPVGSKKETKSVSVTVRLSRAVADQLKMLAKSHSLSQADVIEELVKQEHKLFLEERKKGKG